MMRALIAATALLATPLHAADVTERFYGYAYDLDTNKYLYTEVHEQNIVGGQWVSGVIAYYAPDGKELGRKTLDFSADPFIPLYRYNLPGEKYSESITGIGEFVSLSKTVDGREKTGKVKKKDPIAADSGFHNFLVKHFADLLARKTVPFTFIAAGNLDSYKFRVRRIDDAMFDGKSAVRFYIEPDSLLRLVAPALTVTYDPDKQQLREYRGPSNVQDPTTGKVYNARIAYHAEPPADAPTPLPPLK